MSRNIHFELLLGRKVRDANGRVVGRIREVRAQRRGEFFYVAEYLLGPAAWFEALGISSARLIGWRIHEPIRIPWQQLDLSDPEKPRLKN